ncbi:MAG: tyrosine-type recombinase/integrase [Lachnospirales bacterium]
MANAKKRDNGDGSVFFSESTQKWWAKIQYGTKNGKPLIKAFSSSDAANGKRIVTKKLREFKKLMYSGKVSISHITVNEYIEKWLKNYQKFKVKTTTYNRDWATYKAHIKYTIGSRKLAEINTEDIQLLLNNEVNYYAPKTIEKTLSLLNKVCKYGVTVGDIVVNPCSGVVMPSIYANKIKQKEIEEYTIQETDAMYDGIYDSYYNHKGLYKNSPAYILLLNTGLRLGEALALKWDMIDFDSNFLKIKATLETVTADKGREKILTVPKTKSSYRTVPINKMAKDMLMELKIRNELQCIESDFVICNLKGECCEANNFRRDFKRFCTRYGIKYRGLHTLRHTFASRLFRNGADVVVVSKLLGHNNPTITQNIYIHILEEQKVKTIKLLDAI